MGLFVLQTCCRRSGLGDCKRFPEIYTRVQAASHKHEGRDDPNGTPLPLNSKHAATACETLLNTIFFDENSEPQRGLRFLEVLTPPTWRRW